MSSILELAKLVGVQGSVQAGEYFRISVVIQDVSVRHGRTVVLVEPIAGTGSAWIDLTLLQLEETETADVCESF